MMKKRDESVKEKTKEETAEKLMTKKIPVVSQNFLISGIEKLLNEKAHEFETINYIYVIGKNKELIGVLSIKEIFKQQKNAVVKDLMKTNIVSARPHTDQEKVAMLALKNNIKAIPIVDKENRLLGVISEHTIIDILHREGIEDVLRSAGIRKFKDPAIEIISASTKTHFKKRLPWLIIGLFGGVLAALIVTKFEKEVSHVPL